MSFAQISQRLYLEPWAILPSAHGALSAAFRNHISHGATDLVGPKMEGQPIAPQVRVAGRTAVVPVHGALGRHLSLMEMYCGGCDYAILTQQLRNAEKDASIDHIVLDFRSPGGMAAGLEETCDVLNNLGKHTIAYTDGQCCSAAYALAVQCDETFGAPSSTVGSLGTLIAFLDSSRAMEMQGLSLEVFRSGPLKAAPLQGESLNDTTRAFYQGKLEEFDAVFRQLVARNRPGIDYQGLGGAWMTGRAGMDAGLLDALIPCLPDLLDLLST